MKTVCRTELDLSWVVEALVYHASGGVGGELASLSTSPSHGGII